MTPGRLARLALALALALGPASISAAVTEESTATLDPFGKVLLYRDVARPSRVVLLLSDADGWNRPDVESARALATLDALVVGVDVRRYLATLAERGGDALYPFADLEVLSQFVQKKAKLPAYVPPVVVGRGVGATLAYSVAAAPRPSGIAAAVSLGFCSAVALPRPLGEIAADPGDAPGTYRLRPTTRLVAPWTVLVAPGTVVLGECDPDEARRFAAASARDTTVLAVPPAAPLDDPETWLPHLRLVLERASGRPTTAPSGDGGAVGDLPLVEVPAHGTPRALAVVLSGDGGWASLDREVGDALASAEVGVVGLNSLSYFWTKRTPDGAAADLARIVRHYRDVWRSERVVLVGYSRGADVLPFLAARLPSELRDAVALVALLGPARTTDFEFHLTDWLGGDDPSALPVAPEIAKLGDVPVLCVQGADETESLCPLLAAPHVRHVMLPGGHHFGGDYGVIATRILAEAGLAQRASPASASPSAQPSPANGAP